MFGFFGSINPLSNFHPAPFLLDGQTFHCSEQLIQFKKVKYFKDNDAARHILATKNGSECKLISREIKSYDHELWKKVAKENCIEGILHKFLQNPLLQKILLETGDKQLVECCYDTLWGTGVPLKEETCLNPVLWHNQGIMGEMLEEVRDKLRSNITRNDIISPTPESSNTSDSIMRDPS